MTVRLEVFLPYLITGGFTVLIVALLGTIYTLYRRSQSDEKFQSQLQELIDGEIESSAPDKVTYITRWNSYWSNVFRGAGIKRYEGVNNVHAGRDVIFGAVAIALFLFFITQNIFVGIGASALLVYGLSSFLRMKHRRASSGIDKQLPGFLFALKANLQAGDSNERAMQKVVDSMPSPLYDDLVVVKERLMAQGTFAEAIANLKEKTTSKDLKFLCSCIIQATTSGSSLTAQIDSIQKVLEARRAVADEVNKAVKAVQPAIYLASVIIPGLFLASYFSDTAAQNYWFVEPFSWIAILIVIVFYVIGLTLTRKMINKIKDM